MSPTTYAEIPQSFLEYKVSYQEALLPPQALSSQITPVVFRALREWVALENVSYKQDPANLGEVTVTFSLLGGRVALTIALGFASLLVRDPNWSQAQLIAGIARTGMAALFSSGEIVAGPQRATIAMHVKPASGRTKELVADLIRPREGALTTEDVSGYGLSVYRQNSSWVVDTSALYSEALFIRIERSFGAEVQFEEISSTLRKDEIELMNLLQLDIGAT